MGGADAQHVPLQACACAATQHRSWPPACRWRCPRRGAAGWPRPWRPGPATSGSCRGAAPSPASTWWAVGARRALRRCETPLMGCCCCVKLHRCAVLTTRPSAATQVTCYQRWIWAQAPLRAQGEAAATTQSGSSSSEGLRRTCTPIDRSYRSQSNCTRPDFKTGRSGAAMLQARWPAASNVLVWSEAAETADAVILPLRALALARVCGEPNLPVPLAHPLHVRPLKAAGAVAARCPAESVCSFDGLGLTVCADFGGTQPLSVHTWNSTFRGECASNQLDWTRRRCTLSGTISLRRYEL
jgi:hypothetical protein